MNASPPPGSPAVARSGFLPVDPHARPVAGAEGYASAILHALPAAVLICRADGTVLDGNTAAETLFQRTHQQLCGRQLAELCEGGTATPLLDMVARCAAMQAPVRQRNLALCGPRFDSMVVDAAVAPLPGYSGAAQGGTGESHAQEAALIVQLSPRESADRLRGHYTRQENLRAVGLMAAMLAHEIKNPLAGIQGAAQLLARHLDPADAPLAALIGQDVQRIRRVIAAMEVFTGTEQPILRPVNVHAALLEARALTQADMPRLAPTGTSVQFREAFDPSLPDAAADPALLAQVVQNLLQNAVRAVSGRVRQDHPPEVVLHTTYRRGYRVPALVPGDPPSDVPIRLTVEDTGDGVPDTIRERLFEPFVTQRHAAERQDPGAVTAGLRAPRGLGLAIVAKLVRDMGGAVEYERRHQRTYFHVYLARWRGVAAD